MNIYIAVGYCNTVQSQTSLIEQICFFEFLKKFQKFRNKEVLTNIKKIFHMIVLDLG